MLDGILDFVRDIFTIPIANHWSISTLCAVPHIYIVFGNGDLTWPLSQLFVSVVCPAFEIHPYLFKIPWGLILGTFFFQCVLQSCIFSKLFLVGLWPLINFSPNYLVFHWSVWIPSSNPYTFAFLGLWNMDLSNGLWLIAYFPYFCNWWWIFVAHFVYLLSLLDSLPLFLASVANYCSAIRNLFSRIAAPY